MPDVTDPAVAEQETELAVLSAVAHGNGPNGLTVVLVGGSGHIKLDSTPQPGSAGLGRALGRLLSVRLGIGDLVYLPRDPSPTA